MRRKKKKNLPLPKHGTLAWHKVRAHMQLKFLAEGNMLDEVVDMLTEEQVKSLSSDFDTDIDEAGEL